MIVGVVQYLQSSICFHALYAIDRRINNTALKAKMEAMKVKVVGGETEKPMPQREKKKFYEIF